MLLCDFNSKAELLSLDALRALMGDKPGPTESTQPRGSPCVPMYSYRENTPARTPDIKNLSFPNAELHIYKVESSNQVPGSLLFLLAVPRSTRNLIKLPQQVSTK